jgi:high-affinity nickel-transport protein
MGGFIHPEMMGMAALVFVLGLRHGFDPDHLVAINGMTRSGKSRWCGLFFSLGHGVVVTLVASAVAIAAAGWRAPAWLEPVGAGISIAVLLALGAANLLIALRTPAGELVSLAGMRSAWLAERLAQVSHPMVIVSVGAAFALSFDTISYAVLFSLTGTSAAGWILAAVLGLVFTLGMVVTDALNGFWVAHVIGRADRRAAVASRWMSYAIAFLCFVLAAIGFAKSLVPAVEERFDNFAVGVSLAAFLVILASYGLASRISRASIPFRI